MWSWWGETLILWNFWLWLYVVWLICRFIDVSEKHTPLVEVGWKIQRSCAAETSPSSTKQHNITENCELKIYCLVKSKPNTCAPSLFFLARSLFCSFSFSFSCTCSPSWLTCRTRLEEQTSHRYVPQSHIKLGYKHPEYKERGRAIWSQLCRTNVESIRLALVNHSALITSSFHTFLY